MLTTFRTRACACWIVLASIPMLLSCDSPTDPVPQPASISVSPDSIILRQFGSQQLVVTVYDDQGERIPSPDLIYESYRDYSVSVTSHGLVRSVGPAGNVYIKISARDANIRVLVRVEQVATTILARPLSVVVAAGGSYDVDAWVLDAIGELMIEAQPEFTSDDPALFSVDHLGVITSTGSTGIGRLRITHAALSETIDVTITPQLP